MPGGDDDIGRQQLARGGRVPGDLLHEGPGRDRPDPETRGSKRDRARDLLRARHLALVGGDALPVAHTGG